MKHSLQILWFACVAAVIAVRASFFLVTPPFDGDSLDIVLGARWLLDTGRVPMDRTLPILLVAGLFKLFGEHLMLARLPQLLGGLGAIALVWKAGMRTGTLGGPLAGLLLGFFPITILYGSLASSYSLMMALIFGGAFALDKAVTDEKGTWSVLSGTLFISAFLCHYIALLAMAPVLILLAYGLFKKRAKPFVKPAMFAAIIFGVGFVAILLWRRPEYGWHIISDTGRYDRFFELMKSMYSGVWIGLTDFWGLGIALIVPGILVLAHRTEPTRRLGALGLYGVLYCAIHLFVWLFNPVHHSPRAMLPALPFVALLVAGAFAWLADQRQHLGTLAAWVAASAASTLVIYPLRNTDSSWLFTPTTLRGIALTVLVTGAVFLLLQVAATPLKASRLRGGFALTVLFMTLIVGSGLVVSRQILTDHARSFHAQSTLVLAAGTQGLLGGEHYQSLAYTGPHSVPRFLDLEPGEMDQVLNGRILEVCRARGISHVLISRKERAALLPVLADLAMKRGIRITDSARVLRPLDDPANATRLMDNEVGTLFVLTGAKAVPWTTDQRDRINRYRTRFTTLPCPYASLSLAGPGQVVFQGTHQQQGRTLTAYLVDQDEILLSETQKIVPGTDRYVWDWATTHPGKDFVVEFGTVQAPPVLQVGGRISKMELSED